MPLFELHVARRVRRTYGIEDALFATDGRAVFADFAASRKLAAAMNAARPAGASVRAGQINAVGLMEEIQHLVLAAYRDQAGAGAFAAASASLSESLGADGLESLLLRLTDDFPPQPVYRGETDAAAYLDGATDGTPHRETALEEALLIRLANLNPAAAPVREIFDDAPLADAPAYAELLDAARDAFAVLPPFGPDDANLIDFLRAPALASPASLAGQLAFIRDHWAPWLGDIRVRLLRGLDLLKEESKIGLTGPGPALVPRFGRAAGSASGPEPERYSADLDWMPNLVLIAKNTYVWLDQLSRAYRRPITRLDQIPDEELDALRAAGLTGLWLIGLWERSRASRRIKQMMGNPEAVASAYSLLDYAIAEDLGGETALESLRERAARRGIRLASDMVPNHMGIDSRWVAEHPDWFIGLDHPPFPAYSFNGPDLSEDDRVGLQIEDHYYDRTDAAVVFRRWDKRTGAVRFLYHGNDGTSFPWNDTAQLDYLKPEVREAVIRTILDVARRFPIIRFDAAMTLAKRHLQRLWYPEPGAGGAIPSRAEHGLSREDFEAAVPEEFWREVVDRVAAEAPDTLLLAEAFWLMEGYFVRTLGMHRVYNSAFMHMLRDEDNAKYRQVLKNTLEFDPEILKRYVNFMNNPDERTAVEQFGDGDKYFGVCTLLATLPGLPMVGHGQIEGYAEKYGMEYRRAYHDESPKPWLMEGHARRIFPLFHRRRLFAEAANFLLYDFYHADGGVDENVFAHSNRAGGERALVVYHNRYAETRGWIRAAAAYAVKTGPSGSKVLVHKTLRDGLDLSGGEGTWVIFRDQAAGLEYLRPGRELCEKGLYLELHAYECRVFLDFREVRDDRGRLARLAEALRGGGVASLEEALREMETRPAREAFRELIHPAFLEWLMKTEAESGAEIEADAARQTEDKALTLIRTANEALSPDALNEPKAAAGITALFESVRRLAASAPAGGRLAAGFAGIAPESAPIGADVARLSLFGWAACRVLGPARTSALGLDGAFADLLREAGADELQSRQAVHALRALAGLARAADPVASAAEAARRLAGLLRSDSDFRAALLVNAYEGVEYFHRESFDRLLWWIEAAAAVDPLRGLARAGDAVPLLRGAAADSAFRLDRLLAGLA